MRIEKLTDLEATDVRRLVHGYESRRRYEVIKEESEERTQIVLTLASLSEPFVKRWSTSDTMIRWYRDLLDLGVSFGAWNDEGRLVGLAITQKQEWNDTAIVWELHVEPSYRGRGIGRRLLGRVEDAARSEGLRTVVCETHTTNVAAITFYRAVGYTLDGIDLSYYTNQDVERGEVAVFMKKPVRP